MEIQSDKSLLTGLLLTLPVLFLFSTTEYLSVELASAMVSSLLTVFLVFLYFRQTEIQNRQTNIMESQEQLMEANHNPLIDIESVVPSTNAIDSRDKNSITVTLENVGNGVAINPSIFTMIDFEDDYYNPASGDFPLIRQQDITEEDWNQYTNLSTALPPDTSPKTYEAAIQLPYSKGTEDEVHWKTFPETLGMLYKEEVYDINLEIAITVGDVTGEWHDFEVMRFEAYLPDVVRQFRNQKDDAIPPIENPKEELSFYNIFWHELGERGTGIAKGTANPTPWTNKMDELALNAIKKGILADREES